MFGSSQEPGGKSGVLLTQGGSQMKRNSSGAPDREKDRKIVVHLLEGINRILVIVLLTFPDAVNNGLGRTFDLPKAYGPPNGAQGMESQFDHTRGFHQVLMQQ